MVGVGADFPVALPPPDFGALSFAGLSLRVGFGFFDLLTEGRPQGSKRGEIDATILNPPIVRIFVVLGSSTGKGVIRALNEVALKVYIREPCSLQASPCASAAQIKR